jgi:hypothetical protein
MVCYSGGSGPIRRTAIFCLNDGRWPGRQSNQHHPGRRPRAPILYFAPNINNDLAPITQAEHGKIDITTRLVPTYDADNWSFWSPPKPASLSSPTKNLLDKDIAL